MPRAFPFLTRTAAAALTLLALLPHAFAAGPGKQNDFQGRRVLIIGIDGCRRDVMAQVIQDGTAPHLARIASGSRAFWNMEAGGEPSGERNQPTISGPGWSTLFTGVFANKHGVLGNGEKFVAGRFDTAPHFFRYLREAHPKAWLGSIVGDTWPEVNKILIRKSGENLVDCFTIVPTEMAGEGETLRKLNDANVAREAVRCLREENPDVLFLHFLDVDHAGHKFGFSKEVPLYVSTLQKLDALIGTVMQAMETRPQFRDESWLIVVTTDHGGLKKSHGGQTPEERQIFAFFQAPGLPPREERTGQVYQTLVTPTVLNYLGLPIHPAWAFEAEPLKP